MENVNNKNSDFNNLIYTLIELYYKLNTDAIRVPLNIVLTDNLNNSHKDIRSDMIEELSETLNESSNLANGRTVVPHSLNDPINILLNVNRVLEYTKDGSMTWIGTIAHELTHAVDFYQMARKDNLDSYDPLNRIPDYQLFSLWSEYHARKKGYAFLRNLSNVNGIIGSDKEQIDFILSSEWPFHKENHYNDYHRPGILQYDQINTTMQLLGRYSVWCDLFPSYFNLEALREDFIGTTWMVNLFEFLYSHETLDEIFPCFDEFKAIIKQNWSTIQ